MRFPLLLLTSALLMASTPLVAREKATRAAPRSTDFEWMSVATWYEKHEAHVARANSGGADILLLGDSITEGWNNTTLWEEKFPKLKVVNFGIGGDTTANLLWRVENGEIGNLKPRLVVLLIGINNLGRNKDAPEAVMTGIQAIVSVIHARLPTTKIMILGVLPSDEQPKTRMRKKITETNKRLAKNLHDGHSVLVEDFGAAMLEPDGTISPNTMADFLHPTPAGYQRLAAVLFPRVERLMGAR